MNDTSYISCLVMAVLVFWIAFALKSFPSAVRMLRRDVLAVLMACAVVASLVADKTNGLMRVISPPQQGERMPRQFEGHLNVPRILLRGDPLAVTVTSEDIVRGWRVESVSTNETMTYEMPTNATYVGNWHAHGARSSFGNNKVDFSALRASGTLAPTGWSFPIGTNTDSFSSFWYFVDARIRPTPRDAAREIRAAGGPMFAMPGASRLWTAEEADGSQSLTWENFFIGEDTNTPVNAQIRLYENGAFTTSSNDLVTVCRRVEPFDWDGDGLANTIDPDPYTGSADCHGTCAAWYNIACSNILTAVDSDNGTVLTWRSEVNQNAYYFVEVVAESGPVQIVFSASQAGNLGSPVIVAHAGETNTVPLLVGVEYSVTSTAPISVSPPADGYAQVTFDSPRTCIIHWPISFEFAESINEPTRSGGASRMYGVTAIPFDPGGVYSWNASCTCGCLTCSGSSITFGCTSECTCGGSCSATGSFGYEGLSFPVTGGECTCGSESQSDPPVDPNSPASVTVSFSEDALFYEESYTNSPGDVVGRRVSTNATLTCSAYGGPYGGVLDISQSGFSRLVRTGGDQLPEASVTVSPLSSVSYSVQYEPLTHSESANDIKAGATFSEHLSGDTCVSTAELSVVKLKVTPKARIAGFPHRHKVGVREVVDCEATPDVGTWSEAGGGEFTQIGSIRSYRSPITDDRSVLSYSVGNSSYDLGLVFVEPTGIVARSTVAYDFLVPTNYAGGVGMKFGLYVQPETVSFSGIAMEEVPSTTGDHQGYFSNVYFMGEWYHTTAKGAGKWRAIQPGNYWGDDEAIMGEPLPRELPDGTMVSDIGLGAWSDGLLVWDITWGWAEKESSDGDVPVKTIPTPFNQTFQFNAYGTLSVNKFDNTVSRGTNHVFRLNGNVVYGYPLLEVYPYAELEEE